MSIQGRFLKKIKNNEIKTEVEDIKKWEKVERKDLIQRANKYKHDFQQYETIKFLDESIYTSMINIDEADMNQSNLLITQQNLMINLHQEEKKVRIKKEILMKVYIFFIKVEDQLLMLKVKRYFQ